MKVYLSGPMTGFPFWNKASFEEAEEEIRSLHGDWSVFNPRSLFGGDCTKPRAKYMRANFEAIANSDALILLEGWEKSRGSTIEIVMALECGLHVWEYDPIVDSGIYRTPKPVLALAAELIASKTLVNWEGMAKSWE